MTNFYFSNKSQNAGFTLLEVLVVIAILGSLFAMGLFFDFSLYSATSFGTDADIFASVLQRARARAVNNINGFDHGVHINPDNYVLFQGSTYGANPSLDEEISRNPGLSFSPAPDIVFERLSGDTNFEGNINITGYGKTAVIFINDEGLINR